MADEEAGVPRRSSQEGAPELERRQGGSLRSLQELILEFEQRRPPPAVARRPGSSSPSYSEDPAHEQSMPERRPLPPRAGTAPPPAAAPLARLRSLTELRRDFGHRTAQRAVGCGGEGREEPKAEEAPPLGAGDYCRLQADRLRRWAGLDDEAAVQDPSPTDCGAGAGPGDRFAGDELERLAVDLKDMLGMCGGGGGEAPEEHLAATEDPSQCSTATSRGGSSGAGGAVSSESGADWWPGLRRRLPPPPSELPPGTPASGAPGRSPASAAVCRRLLGLQGGDAGGGRDAAEEAEEGGRPRSPAQAPPGRRETRRLLMASRPDASGLDFGFLYTPGFWVKACGKEGFWVPGLWCPGPWAPGLWAPSLT